MLKNTINSHPYKISILQKECIDKIERIFFSKNIKDLVIENYTFKGVRGKFIEKDNFCINFRLLYFDYQFEFYLMYDQFEYYLKKDDKTIEKCIIEDFEETKMIDFFLNFLIHDLNKYNIKYNPLN